MLIFAAEPANFRCIGIIKNTGYLYRESSAEVASGSSNQRGQGG